jgi:hypothetical protein
MCEERKSFIELSVRRDVSPDDIDDFIDAWHETPGNQSLREYLGMDASEYSLWVRVPDALAYIIQARQDQVPLPDVISKECDALQISKHPENRLKSKQLREWLEEQAKRECSIAQN